MPDWCTDLPLDAPFFFSALLPKIASLFSKDTQVDALENQWRASCALAIDHNPLCTKELHSFAAQAIPGFFAQAGSKEPGAVHLQLNVPHIFTGQNDSDLLAYAQQMKAALSDCTMKAHVLAAEQLNRNMMLELERMRQIQLLSEIASWISDSSWQSVALSSSFNQKAAENLVLKLQLMQHAVRSELDDTHLPALLSQYRFNRLQVGNLLSRSRLQSEKTRLLAEKQDKLKRLGQFTSMGSEIIGLAHRLQHIHDQRCFASDDLAHLQRH